MKRVLTRVRKPSQTFRVRVLTWYEGSPLVGEVIYESQEHDERDALQAASRFVSDAMHERDFRNLAVTIDLIDNKEASR